MLTCRLPGIDSSNKTICEKRDENEDDDENNHKKYDYHPQMKIAFASASNKPSIVGTGTSGKRKSMTIQARVCRLDNFARLPRDFLVALMSPHRVYQVFAPKPN